MDKLSKPVFNDEEYKAFKRLMHYLAYYGPKSAYKSYPDDIVTLVNSLQASEYVNENRKDNA